MSTSIREHFDVLAMPRAKAREAYREYRELIQRRHTDEDEAILRGYKAIADGAMLIDLGETIKKGGLRPDRFPKLAVVRADSRECHVEFTRAGSVRYSIARWLNGNHGETATRHFPIGTLPDVSSGDNVGPWRGSTMVPIIPPAFRPGQTQLANYFLLWEPDVWKMEPPGDPALLKHIGGMLYAVVAVWDLSPVERSVLRMTRR